MLRPWVLQFTAYFATGGKPWASYSTIESPFSNCLLHIKKKKNIYIYIHTHTHTHTHISFLLAALGLCCLVGSSLVGLGLLSRGGGAWVSQCSGFSCGAQA